MKRGLKTVTLGIRPQHPLVFDIEIQAGATLVDAYISVVREQQLVVTNDGPRQKGKIVPHLVWDVDFEAAKETRRVALLPADHGDETIYISEPGTVLLRTTVNPIDEGVIGVYELPWRPMPTEQATEVGDVGAPALEVVP